MRLLLLTVWLLACACGTARRGIPVVQDEPIVDPVVRRGQIVFYRNCNPCHPGGAQGIGLALNDKPLPEAAIKAQVRLGVGQMPSFSEEELSDEDVEAVAEYLVWLRDLEPTREAKSADGESN